MDAEKHLSDLHRSLDKDIEGLLRDPEGHVHLKAQEGGLVAAENALIILLAYRFLYRWKAHHWVSRVHDEWNELDPEKSPKKGRFYAEALAKAGDTDFKRWTELARKSVEVLRADYSRTEDEIVAEMIERAHTFDRENDDSGDRFIDDLFELTDFSMERLACNFHGVEAPPAPTAPVYNRILEGVDVTKTPVDAAYFVLTGANMIHDQLPEFRPYLQRLVEEILRRERSGEIEEDAKLPRLMGGHLEAPNYRWLIKNDPERADTWRDMAKRYRINLETN